MGLSILHILAVGRETFRHWDDEVGGKKGDSNWPA
jgi:hypothetical protein